MAERMADKEWTQQKRWQKSPAAKLYAEADRARTSEADLLQSLLELIPYAESRLEDMEEDAADPSQGYTRAARSRFDRAVALAARQAPRCQSPNHIPGEPVGDLLTCASCRRVVCARCEGGSDEAPEVCDGCWSVRNAYPKRGTS